MSKGLQKSHTHDLYLDQVWMFHLLHDGRLLEEVAQLHRVLLKSYCDHPQKPCNHPQCHLCHRHRRHRCNIITWLRSLITSSSPCGIEKSRSLQARDGVRSCLRWSVPVITIMMILLLLVITIIMKTSFNSTTRWMEDSWGCGRLSVCTWRQGRAWLVARIDSLPLNTDHHRLSHCSPLFPHFPSLLQPLPPPPAPSPR